MNTIQNVERFPFYIRQPPDRDWCIPASIEAVTKYHNPTSVKNQSDIITMFQTKGPGIGLKEVKSALKDDFDWVDVEFENSLRKFNDLVKRIEECVVNSTPPIISVPVGPKEEERWHMLVPVGYDETFFRVYNPNPSVIGDYCDVKRSTIERILLERKTPEDAATDMIILSVHSTC